MGSVQISEYMLRVRLPEVVESTQGTSPGVHEIPQPEADEWLFCGAGVPHMQKTHTADDAPLGVLPPQIRRGSQVCVPRDFLILSDVGR